MTEVCKGQPHLNSTSHSQSKAIDNFGKYFFGPPFRFIEDVLTVYLACIAHTMGGYYQIDVKYKIDTDGNVVVFTAWERILCLVGSTSLA